MKKQSLCFTLVLVSWFFAQASFAGTTTTVDITSSGQQRQFIAYVPDSYDASIATPLLFMMHGLTSSAAAAANPNGPYRWQNLADQENFIVLFPNSYQDDSWDMNAADANFVRDMISWASNNYNILQTHIFTTGHSMGAFFSYYIAVQLRNDPAKVTVFAEFAGGLIAGLWPTSVPGSTPQLKGMLLHSSGDSVVPYSTSVALNDALVNAGHLSQLVTLPASLDHNWDRSYNQTQWDFFMANAPSAAPVPAMTPIGILSLVAVCIGFGILEITMRRKI
ncbi:MAG: hypothetical protein VX252_00030 [Myxococcota bacterium]|nr:hypothetical protein [Myxococcota bacterium]